MRLFKTTGSIIFFFLLNGIMVKAQPIPVELMMGNKYGTVTVSLNRSFSQNSRLGVFHMNTVQFDYKDELKIRNTYLNETKTIILF